MATCGICRCESNEWGRKSVYGLDMGVYLRCAEYQLDPNLHEKRGNKQHIVSKGELPPSVIKELEEEIKTLAASLSKRTQ